MNKKLLIIIKSHDKKYANYHNEIYEKLEEINRNYLSLKKDIDFIYIKGNPYIDTNYFFEEERNNFWVKVEENYWEALKIKVVESLKYFIFLNNKKYDYVFITNLSTFINVDKLLSECDYQKEIVCKSVTGTYSFDGINYRFPSGAGVLYSRSLMEKIINYQNTIDCSKYPTTDDIFFGKLIHELKINIQEINRLNIINHGEFTNLINNFNPNHIPSHIRIKLDNNRELEPHFHLLLSNLIYGK